jgi:hypothetical protein
LNLSFTGMICVWAKFNVQYKMHKVVSILFMM